MCAGLEMFGRTAGGCGQDVRGPDDLSLERRVPLVHGREEGGGGRGKVSEPGVAMVRAVAADALAAGIPDNEGTGSAEWGWHFAGGIRS